MQNEKFQVTLGEGCPKAELVIREVDKVNELPVKEPLKIEILGTIGSVYEFLSKRKVTPDQIQENNCHILVSRENIAIKLIFNERDAYNTGKVIGVLSKHPKYTEFGINEGKSWTPTSLGLFFKMNRAFFTTREDNMKLVSDLMNFTATVNNNIEKSAKESGDRSDKFEQVVNSNLPKSFSLKIPIFKGLEVEIIEVETFAQVNGREVSFTLLSPAAQATEEEIRDKVIDEQLDKIRELCPGIAIIEQ
jgi:hypothetical protein